MIPRLHKRGTSFKGACSYILHDAGQKTSDRVLWTETCNVFSAPEDAWFEMFATARDQAELKRQAGKDARGRKNDKPVLHYTLSWAESDNPSPEHMRETALESLKAMKLDGHQAVMAAHKDKAHLHVHIVVNTIHPDTGMTAPLKYTKEQLSRWAEAYEKEHGLHCEQRILNNEARENIRVAKEATRILTARDRQEKSRSKFTYVPVKHEAPTRGQWFERKDIVDRMKRLRAEMELLHKSERQGTWQHQKQQRDALDRDSRAAVDHARAYVHAKFKPQWREIYREQKREMGFVERAASHPLERAVFVFRERERLGQGKPLTLRQMGNLITRPGKLIDRLEAVHEKERRVLAREEKSEAKALTDRIWTQHKTKFERLRTEQTAERQTQRAAQFDVTRSVSFEMAKASLVAEAAQDASRAAAIKQQMDEWRQRNQGRDFGREI